MTGELKFMPKDMKKIIAETMNKMIKKKGSEKITVTALIEECLYRGRPFIIILRSYGRT